ncbi:hypothetical protein L249_3998 [Ophiocordyceps polyrhachis-furcata BCC 54312]|uniref:SUN domain-containing protein n=1 Tax=Ophiocordyceps polyrhachis-furcata BCC 54312 TaxID=1330021 RepID=A0A367L5X5_9HYPO|nr:hypothetical protein L249_3998 [Ophiocordyceps polyrhachis-furcata BCC 54312]
MPFVDERFLNGSPRLQQESWLPSSNAILVSVHDRQPLELSRQDMSSNSSQRWTRAASRDSGTPTPARDGLGAFRKPNLPPLEGTPSARRQYSYGAAVEPPPSRPGRGLQQGQMLNLSNAVRSALVGNYGDDVRDDPFRDRSRNVDPYGDELAGTSGDASYPKPTTQNSRHDFPDSPDSFSRPSPMYSENEDVRSFGTESDYYGDATIISSPAGMPPPGLRASSWAKLRSRKRNPSSSGLQKLTEERIFASKDRSEPLASKLHISGTSLETQRRNAETDASGIRQRPEVQSLQPTDLGRRGRTRSHGPSKLRMSQNNAAVSEQTTANLPESRPRTRGQAAALRAQASNQPAALASQTSAGVSSAASQPGSQVGMAMDGSGNDSCAGSGRWLNGAAKATASNFALRGNGEAIPVPNQVRSRPVDTNAEDQPAMGWRQFVKPRTYMEAMVRFFDVIWQRWVEFSGFATWTNTWQRLMRLRLSLFVGVLAVVLALFLTRAAVSGLRGGSSDGDIWAPTAGGVKWYSPSGISQKVGAYLSTLRPSSPGRWDELDDLWKKDDWQRCSVEEHVKKIEQAYRSLTQTSKLHELSLKKLESVVPKVVHMELRDGKPVVDPAFWHALRDLMHEDDAVMTIDSSEKQLKAMASRLTQQIDSSVNQVEDRFNGRLTHWETWVRENQAKLRERPALEKVRSTAQKHEWDEDVIEMVEERLRDYERRNAFVSRDEYLQYVRAEAERSRFPGGLEQFQPQLQKLVRESVQLAAAELPTGMSRSDMTSLVNGLIREAFLDMNLEALASGQIHAHWETELRNHVNYFSQHAGAHIDVKRSSVSFTPRHGLLDYGDDGGRPEMPQSTALQPWTDDGDCWCAALSRDPQGHAHGALLSVSLDHRIVPQHLVIEHILPGATTDQGARPRDVELYAAIEDQDLRERIRDFAAAHFPDGEWDADDTPPSLPDNFVKIAHTVYTSDELRGGVHVHRLSSELLSLRAATDHVIVRAVSNYGAKDHTCFYRLRLYGRNVDVDVSEMSWK